MNFVVIGSPLSGKGTISKLLSQHLQIPHISMGDLLRNIAKCNNKYSIYISNQIQSGKLINDDLVKIILEDRLNKPDCKKGFVLDGYPRNLEQSKNLDEIIKVDKIIYTTVSEITVIKRMATRYICPKCGLTYSTEKYDKNYCEKCKERLVKRDDDNETTLLSRVKDFNDNTLPVLEKYMVENKLVTISNEGDINDVFEELKGKLNI